jgi:hypothetical protein
MAKQIVNGREFQIYACYNSNVNKEMVEDQKKIFNLFNMEITQELTNLHHPAWMQQKVKSLNDFDIVVFFDIDSIPLKPGLYEYILEQIKDGNSFIGIEQSRDSSDPNITYAGPACIAVTKTTYEKLGNPTFMNTHRADSAGELTVMAKERGVDIKYFYITSCNTEKWKCGNKLFGLGTTYDNDRLYHQFEAAGPISQIQFKSKVNQVLKKYSNR